MASQREFDATKPPVVKGTVAQVTRFAMYCGAVGAGIAAALAVRESVQDLSLELKNTNERMIELAAEVVSIRQDMAVSAGESALRLEQATAARFATIEARLAAVERGVKAP